MSNLLYSKNICINSVPLFFFILVTLKMFKYDSLTVQTMCYIGCFRNKISFLSHHKIKKFILACLVVYFKNLAKIIVLIRFYLDYKCLAGPMKNYLQYNEVN